MYDANFPAQTPMTLCNAKAASGPSDGAVAGVAPGHVVVTAASGTTKLCSDIQRYLATLPSAPPSRPAAAQKKCRLISCVLAPSPFDSRYVIISVSRFVSYSYIVPIFMHSRASLFLWESGSDPPYVDGYAFTKTKSTASTAEEKCLKAFKNSTGFIPTPSRPGNMNDMFSFMRKYSVTKQFANFEKFFRNYLGQPLWVYPRGKTTFENHGALIVDLTTNPVSIRPPTSTTETLTSFCFCKMQSTRQNSNVKLLAEDTISAGKKLISALYNIDIPTNVPRVKRNIGHVTSLPIPVPRPYKQLGTALTRAIDYFKQEDHAKSLPVLSKLMRRLAANILSSDNSFTFKIPTQWKTKLGLHTTPKHSQYATYIPNRLQHTTGTLISHMKNRAN